MSTGGTTLRIPNYLIIRQLGLFFCSNWCEEVQMEVQVLKINRLINRSLIFSSSSFRTTIILKETVKFDRMFE